MLDKATDTQNMKYLLLFHCNNGYSNAPECYIIRTLLVLFFSSNINGVMLGHRVLLR